MNNGVVPNLGYGGSASRRATNPGY